MKQKTDKNYYSGEKIDDLVDAVKNSDYKHQEGNTQADASYKDELYSDKQMENHNKIHKLALAVTWACKIGRFSFRQHAESVVGMVLFKGSVFGLETEDLPPPL